MPHSARLWPGGIPGCIKRHPTGELSDEELKEEVKGWLLFVRIGDDLTDNDNGEYELRQRRALVEQWASASQEFRNSFHARAGAQAETETPRYPAEAMKKIEKTTQEYNPNGLISLAPIDSTHPANRARFIKFSILLYRFDPETGHCLEDSHIPDVAILNPASHSPNTNSFERFLSWSDLEAADFRSIFLTRSGIVLYNGFLGPYLLVDGEGLRTGRLSLVQFRRNGTVEDQVPVCPFNMRWSYLHLKVHMKGHQNMPIDMDLPVLDILSRALAANQFSSHIALCARDQWAEDIELYAPGYLALEEAGSGPEYELTRLSVPDEIAGVEKRVWEKLKTGQVPGFIYFPSLPSEQRLPQLQPQPWPGTPPMDIQAMFSALKYQNAFSYY
ncbi:hypothetical protein BDV10DRAFT_197657 [Aspergillus recurvatus]